MAVVVAVVSYGGDLTGGSDYDENEDDVVVFGVAAMLLLLLFRSAAFG
jgi:hypothetical protein